MAHKNYVIDTSTIVHDINCFKVFEDNTVIIPIAVLEELDHLKIRPDTVGTNARLAIRQLDKYTELGDPCAGVDIGNNIILKIDINKKEDKRFDSGSKDDYILSCALSYENAILVSKDVNMRVRAKAYGISAEDYKNDKITTFDELYRGYRELTLSDEEMQSLIWTNNTIADVKGTPFEVLFPNEFVQVSLNGKNSIYRRLPNDSLQLVKTAGDIYGLKSKNREQAFALDLLLDNKIPLVTLAGKAGSGKTLITIAAALQLLTEGVYSRIEIFRPIQPMGQDIGYLPGDEAAKLAPWMGAIRDAMEFLMGPNYENQLGQYKDKIRMEALTYIRGKSANKCLMILDEAQNITKHEMKTIITRVGHGSKIICTGDIEQIDSNYLDASNNGLTCLIESFKESKLSGHVLLTKGERSELATEASKIL